jgi:hypothetical protein
MFPFPSPLDFLRAFALAFVAGLVAGAAVVTLTLSALSSLKQYFCFGSGV